jgi:hypothetical protein
VLPQNSNPLNRAALKWLKEVNEGDPSYLHLLTLAHWGMENGANGEWPAASQSDMEEQVGHLLRWKPEDVMGWLLDNPNGPDDPKEQGANLLHSLRRASSPKSAATWLLNAIYSRMTA